MTGIVLYLEISHDAEGRLLVGRTQRRNVALELDERRVNRVRTGIDREAVHKNTSIFDDCYGKHGHLRLVSIRFAPLGGSTRTGL